MSVNLWGGEADCLRKTACLVLNQSSEREL